MQLNNKVIFITGASDGIGKATAIECAKQGATVIIHGKTLPKLELLYDEITQAGYTEPVIYPLDFEKMTPEECDTVNQTISKEFGQLDALYNNAGWLGAYSPIQHYDIPLWHRVLQINLNATVMLTQACLPLLNHDKPSSIIFTLDDQKTAYSGAYGVAKSGLKSFMQILADELEETHINVCGLNPGPVRTNFRTRAFPGEDPRSLTKPEEVAKAALYLLSGESHNKNTHGKTLQLSDLTS